MIEFNVPVWQVIQLLAGTVLPLLVALVTTRITAPGRRAVLLAGLSVATSILTELGSALQTHQPYNLGLALLFGVGTFIVAVATHYGLWKATGVAEKAQNILVTASPRAIARAEEEKARELLTKAGIRTAAPSPGTVTVKDGPNHRADDWTADADE